MSFEDACLKEMWFFDTLLADDSKTRALCGIHNLRETLVGMYAQFVSRHMQRVAPVIFQKMVAYKDKLMFDKWGWTSKLENYENPAKT